MRIDFSSDGNWIRAEAHGKAETIDTTPVVTILLSASSGEICEDKTVRTWPVAGTDPIFWKF